MQKKENTLTMSAGFAIKTANLGLCAFLTNMEMRCIECILISSLCVLMAMAVMSSRFLNLIVMTKKIISQKQRDWLSMFKNVQMSVVYKC